MDKPTPGDAARADAALRAQLALDRLRVEAEKLKALVEYLRLMRRLRSGRPMHRDLGRP